MFLKGLSKESISTTEVTDNETVITEREKFTITFKIVDRYGNIRTIQS